jgi:choline dehydrogenase-like flavoprotein
MSDIKPRPRLARTLSELQADLVPGLFYDVVIVGSGYGGSVAAQQLAGLTVADGAQRRPIRVLLLERGREFHAGDFPATFGELPRELRVGRQTSGEVTGPMGLYDLRLGDDVNALVANGLGGGSLINAGVMLAPRPEDFSRRGAAARPAPGRRTGVAPGLARPAVGAGGRPTFHPGQAAAGCRGATPGRLV